MDDDEKAEFLTRINFNYEVKKFDYFRPSQVRDVPLKYKSVRGYIPSLKTYLYPQFNHLKELVLNYESQLERDFLYLLDHDPNCLDLQTQPCSIQYVTINGREVSLYPDVWALFSNGDQILFEVKPEGKLRKLTKDQNWSKRIEAIRNYCKERGWIYQFITEKKIKCVRLDNIKDLLVSAKHYAPSKTNLNLNNFNTTLENILNDFNLTFSKLINIMSLKLPLNKSEVISLIKYKIYYGHLFIDWDTPLGLTEISKKRKSKSNSKGINGIYNNTRNGTWKEFGIESWNDLLRLVFGEIHIEMGKYVGKKGLNRAIREMREYKEKNGKNPTSKTDGFKGIYDNVARRGQWKQFGINSWNDLIKYVFGDVKNRFWKDQYRKE